MLSSSHSTDSTGSPLYSLLVYVCVSEYCCKVFLALHCTALTALHNCTTVLLYYCTTVLLYYCYFNTPLLYTTLQYCPRHNTRHCCTTLLYCIVFVLHCIHSIVAPRPPLPHSLTHLIPLFDSCRHSPPTAMTVTSKNLPRKIPYPAGGPAGTITSNEPLVAAHMAK